MYIDEDMQTKTNSSGRVIEIMFYTVYKHYSCCKHRIDLSFI